MQLIFKFDFETLKSYAADSANNIRIATESGYTMLCFPDVPYFNYTFHHESQCFSETCLKNIKAFYRGNNITHFEIIANAGCPQNNELLIRDRDLTHRRTIVKTVFWPKTAIATYEIDGLAFIKADKENIDLFTDTYLRGFEAPSKNQLRSYRNVRTLLEMENLDLFLLKYHGSPVGINILYKTPVENLLAGGAVLPEFRNKGFHKMGLAYRINESLVNHDLCNIVSWAYRDSVSLKNMLKLQMRPQEEYNVYEYNR